MAGDDRDIDNLIASIERALHRARARRLPLLEYLLRMAALQVSDLISGGRPMGSTVKLRRQRVLACFDL